MPFVARYGGEKFAIIVPYTPKEDIGEVVERIRAKVEKMRVSGVGITIGVGVGHFDCKNTELKYKDLIKRSDEALYLAKRKGKNRVEIKD